MNSFVRRRIDYQFQLGQGDFGEGGYDTVEVTGLRSSASITKAGATSMCQAQVRIYGLSLSVMNRLSTLGKPLIDGRNNIVTISPGDDVAGVSVAFVGVISEAWVDMGGAPDGVFILNAHTGIDLALKPVTPASYQGAATVETIMSGLAAQSGLNFENNGLTVTLADPYFPGTALVQIDECAKAAGIAYKIDDTTLAIWPQDGTRGGQIPVLGPDTGLIGYPAHTENGITLLSLYNRSVTFGSRVQVQSVLTPAVGVWSIFGLSHDLEAEEPNGRWFTTLQCNAFGKETSLAR